MIQTRFTSGQRMLVLVSILAVALAMGLLAGGRHALAVQGDNSFAYEGTGTTKATIFNGNTDPFTVPIDGGEITLGATIAVNLSSTLKPFADFQISVPDGGIVEGETVPVTLKLVAKDGSVQEFILNSGFEFKLRAGYDGDANGLACVEFGGPGGTAADDDSCVEWDLADLVGLGTIKLLNEDMVAPYEGGTYSPPEKSTTLASVPVCELLIGLDVCSVDIIGTMNATLSATAGPGGGPMPAVTTGGFHSQRSILVGATEGASTQIKFPNSNQLVDNVEIACGGSPGSSVSYKLSQNHYDARITALTFGIDLLIALQDPVPDIGPFNLFGVNVIPLFDHPLNVFAVAPNYQIAMGTYQAEQVPPTINSVTPPTGAEEGKAALFAASAEDNCPGALTYRWDFSDGGVAFGAATAHAAPDNGVTTFRLTVCDRRNNCAHQDGFYAVANLAPVANAGPDVAGAWGRSLQFGGHAFDSSPIDQQTLSCRWDFGDGTVTPTFPASAAGGCGVTHAYSLPGTYTATLKVCDKNGDCHSDTASVVVRKRQVSLGYTGASAGIFDTPALLRASLVDEFGQTVNGRQVSFAIGPNVRGTTQTDSTGIASVNYRVLENQGSHALAASFAGDGLYESGDSASGFTVAHKATSMVYTGALTGAPNKVITLSATLVDAEGKPLAGKTVVFQVGSQTVSAVTNSSGIASTSMKLNQKNGTYTVSATYTPAGADTGLYLGSQDSKTFKLQAK